MSQAHGKHVTVYEKPCKNTRYRPACPTCMCRYHYEKESKSMRTCRLYRSQYPAPNTHPAVYEHMPAKYLNSYLNIHLGSKYPWSDSITNYDWRQLHPFTQEKGWCIIDNQVEKKVNKGRIPKTKRPASQKVSQWKWDAGQQEMLRRLEVLHEELGNTEQERLYLLVAYGWRSKEAFELRRIKALADFDARTSSKHWNQAEKSSNKPPNTENRSNSAYIPQAERTKAEKLKKMQQLREDYDMRFKGDEEEWDGDEAEDIQPRKRRRFNTDYKHDGKRFPDPEPWTFIHDYKKNVGLEEETRRILLYLHHKPPPSFESSLPTRSRSRGPSPFREDPTAGEHKGSFDNISLPPAKKPRLKTMVEPRPIFPVYEQPSAGWLEAKPDQDPREYPGPGDIENETQYLVEETWVKDVRAKRRTPPTSPTFAPVALDKSHEEKIPDLSMSRPAPTSPEGSLRALEPDLEKANVRQATETSQGLERDAAPALKDNKGIKWKEGEQYRIGEYPHGRRSYMLVVPRPPYERKHPSSTNKDGVDTIYNIPVKKLLKDIYKGTGEKVKRAQNGNAVWFTYAHKPEVKEPKGKRKQKELDSTAWADWDDMEVVDSTIRRPIIFGTRNRS